MSAVASAVRKVAASAVGPDSMEGYAPSANEDYMCPRQLAYFKAKLTAMRATAMAELQAINSETAAQSRDIGDDADLAAHHAHNEARLRDAARLHTQVSALSSALQRIQTGEYGYCDETGEEIGLARLAIQPAAMLSVDAQERREYQRKAFVTR